MTRTFKDEMRRMHRRMNSWLRNFDEDPWDFDEEDLSQYRKAWVDARELEDEFLIAVELPGVSKDDIELNVEDNTLILKVEKDSQEKEEDEESGSFSFQRNYTGFYRRIPLPANSEPENIEAEYKNGILRLHVPKKAKPKKGKQIKIK